MELFSKGNKRRWLGRNLNAANHYTARACAQCWQVNAHGSGRAHLVTPRMGHREQLVHNRHGHRQGHVRTRNIGLRANLARPIHQHRHQ